MVDPLEGGPRDLDVGRQIRFAVTPTGVGCVRHRQARSRAGRSCGLGRSPGDRVVVRTPRSPPAYDKPGCGLSDPSPVPRRWTATSRCCGRSPTTSGRPGRPARDLDRGCRRRSPLPCGTRTRRDGWCCMAASPTVTRWASAEGPARPSSGPDPGALGARVDVLADIFLPDGTPSDGALRPLQRESVHERRGRLPDCWRTTGCGVDDLLDRVDRPTLVHPPARRPSRALPVRTRAGGQDPGGAAGVAGRPAPLRLRRRRRAIVGAILGFLGAFPPRAARRTACPGGRHAAPRQLQVAGPGRRAPYQPPDRPAGWGSRNGRRRGTWSRIRQRLGVRSRTQIAAWWASTARLRYLVEVPAGVVPRLTAGPALPSRLEDLVQVAGGSR